MLGGIHTFPVSGFLYPVPSFLYPVPGFRYPVVEWFAGFFCIRFSVSRILLLNGLPVKAWVVSSSTLPGTGYWVP